MFGSDLKQLIVLDDIRDKLDMVDSDIIPETCTHPIVSGIENVPTSIVSANGNAYASSFTTFPLSPLQGRVHYIKDSFINFSIDVNFGIRVSSNILKDIVLAVGPRDTASIFNQLQLMIDNNVIWNTTYQAIESAIDLAGLPASVVDHSPNYATIDKLLNNKQTPMQLITIPTGNYVGASSKVFSYSLTFDLSVDLNRLAVPLSNIAFITSNMGNLRLKVYLNNFHQSFYVFQFPQGAFIPAGSDSGAAMTQTVQVSSLLSLDPIPWGSASSSSNNWTFSNPYLLKAPFLDTITINETVTDSTRTAITGYDTSKALIPIQFLLDVPAGNFMEVKVGQICQTCFDIKEESYNILCDYFQQTGKVIIPLQAWATSVFNNGTLEAGTSFPSTVIANVPGNNITTIALTSCVANAPSCLFNPYRSQFQALLDGKPLNNTPYDKVDARAIQDFTNACIDTDHEEINTDYLYSMQFPQFYSNGTSKLTDPQQYFYTTDAVGDTGAKNELTWFSTQGYSQGIAQAYQKNPNLFMYIFQTAIPDSFHTGMCIIEYSNRQALFRFSSSNSPTTAANYAKRFYQAAGTVVQSNGTVTLPNNGAQIYPSMPNYSNVTSQINISCLCDECLVLDYDSNINTCTGGYLSYTKPYIAD